MYNVMRGILHYGLLMAALHFPFPGRGVAGTYLPFCRWGTAYHDRVHSTRCMSIGSLTYMDLAFPVLIVPTGTTYRKTPP